MRGVEELKSGWVHMKRLTEVRSEKFEVRSNPVLAMREAWELAGRIVREARAGAPKNFDPQNAGASAPPQAAAEEKAGMEADGDLMAGVYERLGLSYSFGGNEKATAKQAEEEGAASSEEGAASAAAKGEKGKGGKGAGEPEEEGEDSRDGGEGSEGGEEEAEEQGGKGEGEQGGEGEQEGDQDQEGQEEEGSPNVETVKAEYEEKLALAEQRIAELETDAKAGAPQLSGRVHPILLETDPAKIEALEKSYRDFEKWAAEHWDGYEATKEGEQSWTAEQIRRRAKEIEQEREEIIPQARQLVQARQHWDGVAVKAYPELKDARSKEYQVARKFLTLVPELKKLPNAMMLIGDMLAGERQRMARMKVRATEGKGAKGAKVNGAEKGKGAEGKGGKGAVAPKVPIGAGAGRTQVKGTQPAKVTGTVSAQNFVKRGGDHNALVQTIMEAGIV